MLQVALPAPPPPPECAVPLAKVAPLCRLDLTPGLSFPGSSVFLTLILGCSRSGVLSRWLLPPPSPPLGGLMPSPPFTATCMWMLSALKSKPVPSSLDVST